MGKHAHIGILFIMSLYILNGCTSLDEQLDKQYDKARSVEEQARADRQNREKKELLWSEAVELLLENNLEIRRSELRYERSIEDRKQIFKNLIPSLRISANISETLGQLGQVTSDDLRLSVFSAVNIPGLISLRQRYYAASLAIVRAKLDLELLRREKIATLREQFLEYKSLELRRAGQKRNKLLRSAQYTRPFDQIQATPESLRAEQQDFSLDVAEENYQQQLSDLLGDYSSIWQPVVDSIPEFSYVEDPLDLEKLETVGVLVRKRLAADYEAFRLRELGAKLDFFPDLRTGFSAPPLFQRSGGRTSEFNAEDIRLRASSSLTLDTQGRLRKRLGDVREDLELQREEVRNRIYRELEEAKNAQEELRLAAQELRLAELRLETFSEPVDRLNLEKFRERIEQLSVLTDQVASLTQRKARLESAFWLLDDRAWDAFDIEAKR